RLSRMTESMIRVPRMHALPWQTAGLTLIRSFQFSIDSILSRKPPACSAGLKVHSGIKHELAAVITRRVGRAEVGAGAVARQHAADAVVLRHQAAEIAVVDADQLEIVQGVRPTERDLDRESRSQADHPRDADVEIRLAGAANVGVIDRPR